MDNYNREAGNQLEGNDPPDYSRYASILVDPHKYISDCNPAAEKLFKLRKKDFTGLPFEEFIRARANPLGISKLLNGVARENPETSVDIELKGRKELYNFTVHASKNEGFVQIIIRKAGKITTAKEPVKVDIMYLAALASELTDINNEGEVFEFLASKLKELYPGVIILINRSNDEGTHLRLVKILGIENSLLYNLIKLLGFNPVGKQYVVSDEFRTKLSRPKLHNYEGNLAQFVNNEIPERIAQIVEKTLKIRDISTIGIADNGQFFGFIHLLRPIHSESLNKSVLESIVYLCYLSIARIKTLKSLEESERKYKLLADNVKDVIFTLDLNLRYTYISPSVKTLRGYEPWEVIGEPIHKSISQKSLEFIQKLLSEKLEDFKSGRGIPMAEYVLELELTHRNGGMVQTEVKASFILDYQNKPTGILGVTRDITERKIAEKELLKKNNELNEANAQKDKLFSIIAHDLRNPFGHILNFSGLLLDHYDHYSTDRRKQFIELINKSSQQIYLLLENLLDWARSQSGKMEFYAQQIKLEKMVVEVIDLLTYSANSKNIKLQVYIPEGIVLCADEFMLKTILRNLIGNAIKFTPDGGIVQIVGTEDRNEISLSVIDNGVGMDSDLTSSLFTLDLSLTQPGTKGEKGTGLGLLLCKEFVEQHGGKIWVSSTLGVGSSFSFSIPHKNSPTGEIP
jgi:PAS domain S-box-containing protein